MSEQSERAVDRMWKWLLTLVVLNAVSWAFLALERSTQFLVLRWAFSISWLAAMVAWCVALVGFARAAVLVHRETKRLREETKRLREETKR